MTKKESASLVSLKYDRKSLLAESWERIRTNPGAVFGIVVLLIIFGLMIYSFLFISYEDITAIDPLNINQPPSKEHLFGTDNFGRDLFARTIYGTRYSLAVGFGSVALGLILGVFFGAIAGFFGGWIEEIIMRASDVLAAIPALLLGFVIVAALGPSLVNLLLCVGISMIPSFVRMTRASILTAKSNEYVESSKAIGMSEFRIVFSQVLPNSMSPLIVTSTSRMATAILMASSLSFLGFGVPVPLPEWGALVSGGRNFLRLAPHLTLYPGLFIMVMTFACALLGDGLRDALDPRLKK